MKHLFFLLLCCGILLAQEQNMQTSSAALDSQEWLKRIGDSYRNRHYSQALEYAKEACDLGHLEACGALGNLYSSELEEMKDKKDLNQAAYAYFKACEGNIAAACFYLGVFHTNGVGVQRNYHSARGFFKRACDLNDADSCDALGNFYANTDKNIMPKQDYTQAANYYLKACEGGLGSACFKLATLYRIGQGVRADISIAKNFYGKSCQLGDPKGCEAWWSMENVKPNS